MTWLEEQHARREMERYELKKLALEGLVRLYEDRNGDLITVKQAAAAINMTPDYVLQLAEDLSLNVNVGIGTQNGHAKLPKSEWTLEDLNYGR